MSIAVTIDKRREELENVLMLVISNVREYRDREQDRLSEPDIAISELMRRVGGYTALRNVESMLMMIAELYGVEV